MSLGGPIFDVEKLNWLNGQWIKALSPAELLDTLLAWKADRAKLEEIAAVIQPRINLLSEAVNWSSHYFNHFPTLTKEQFESKNFLKNKFVKACNLRSGVWKACSPGAMTLSAKH